MHEEMRTTFKKHEITVERDTETRDWYITVEAPGGGLIYDGWWIHSEDKTAREAIKEAKRGAMLIDA